MYTLSVHKKYETFQPIFSHHYVKESMFILTHTPGIFQRIFINIWILLVEHAQQIPQLFLQGIYKNKFTVMNEIMDTLLLK